MKHLKRALIALVFLALALPFIPADLFRARIQRALEQGLGRKVEIGAVHFTLLPGVLPGPGFTLDQVLIHEDPRAGIEPFAYVESLGASVRLLSLFSRRLELSNLNLGDATINIAQTAQGPWNFQYLLAGAPTNTRAMPSVRMRAGRVNFKFGDTKSVVYFNNADLDVASAPDGSFELRFGGAPSRTDRPAQEFGRLFVRGTSSADHRMNFRVELDRSEIEETLQWMMPSMLGVHGTVSLQAQLSGPPSHLNVSGNLEIGDVHRWDLLPAEASRWRVNYTGTLDLQSEQLKLATAPAQPVTMHLRASNWLTKLAWDATAEITQVPLTTLAKFATHMGAPIPAEVTADGTVSGSLSYNQAQGLSGRVEVAEASLSLPEAPPLRAAAAIVAISSGAVRLEKAVVQAGERQVAEVEATYTLAEPRDLDLRISTRALDVALMRSFALAGIPVIQETPKGTWRGSARYRAGVWTGAFDLRDASVSINGIAKPVEIRSASVNLNGARVAITRLRAHASGIEFTGEYRWDAAASTPHKFVVTIPEADSADLQQLFAPTLLREGNFLARTLRLGSIPKPPDWLTARKAEGTIAIESLTLPSTTATNVSARVRWNGVEVIAGALKATVESGTLIGDLHIGLATSLPQLHFEGRIDGLSYRGGELSLEGTLDAGGDTRDFRTEGTLRGRAIEFAPDAEFRTITADFESQGFTKWKFANVEANQAGEILSGSAATQPDGKLQFELTGRGRQVRYSAAL